MDRSQLSLAGLALTDMATPALSEAGQEIADLIHDVVHDYRLVWEDGSTVVCGDSEAQERWALDRVSERLVALIVNHKRFQELIREVVCPAPQFKRPAASVHQILIP